MADSKELAVKASIDIGGNTTKLIDRLAAQIGTTTDKVFPWYVKQQVIEGWCWIGCSVFGAAVGICVCLFAIKKWDNGKNADNELNAIALTIGVIILLIALVFLIFGTSGAVTQITNPQYYALKAMTGDMARLIGK